MAGPGFKTSLELGYAMDYSNSYEKSYLTETSCEWTADKMDIVVMSRVPQLVYTYDLWDAEKGKPVIPNRHGPRFFGYRPVAMNLGFFFEEGTAR